MEVKEPLALLAEEAVASEAELPENERRLSRASL